MNPGPKTTINISNRTILRIILWATATILLFHFIGRISRELTLIFVSFFLALALNPVVSWLTRRIKLRSRVMATSLAYLIIVVFLAGFFALVTPPLVKQTRQFINQVPTLVHDFQQKDNGISRAAKRYHLDRKLSQAATDFASSHSNFGSTILDTGKKIIEIVASILAVLVVTFMMLVEGPRWFEFYWRTLPSGRREHQKQLAYKMYKGVSGFVNGQVVIALIAGIFATVALEIASRVIGVSINVVALGGIVAVLGIIPLFGNPLAALVVILVSLLNSMSLAIVMLIYFVIYFFVENHTLQPYVQSRLNQLTALSVFVAAIIGVGFAGFLGAIVAIPAASTLKVLAEDQIERRGLKNRTG